MTRCVLDDIYEFLGRFIVFPNEASRETVTVWIAHTALIDAFGTTPRLWITAATSKCGKTTLADIIELLTPRALGVVAPSASSIFRIIEKKHPTLIIDQIDDLFDKKDISDIVAILNSGFQRGKKVTRVEQVGSEYQVKEYETFGPMVLVGIDKGNIPEPVLSRCIAIRMKPRLSDEAIEDYSVLSDIPAEGRAIRDRLEQWASSVVDAARSARPMIPKGIGGRDKDKLQPLFVTADLADGTQGTDDTCGTVDAEGTVSWGDRIRLAAVEQLTNEGEAESLDQTQLLLAHLGDVFDRTPKEKYKTTELLDELRMIEDAPWSDFAYGKALSANGLGKLLRRFDIHPHTIRFSSKDQAKGYYRSDFEDVLRRHIIRTPSIPAVPDVFDVPAVPEAPVNSVPAVLYVPGTNVPITPGMTYEQYMDAKGSPPSEW